MKLPKLENFSVEVDLWSIKPDVYIDLRPFPYGITEQAYAYSFGGEVFVSSKEELFSKIDEKAKLGLILPNNMISTKFFLIQPEQDVYEIARTSFGSDSAFDILYVGDMGLERAYIVNAVDSASKRIVESQLPLAEPTVVRVIPASFAVSCFLRSQTSVEGTYLIVECRPYEIYLYSCAIIEGAVVTLSSDIVKTNVSNALSEKIVFMNHKAVRFYRTDSILQVFVVAGENAVMPTESVLKIVSSALKGKAKVSTEVVEEPFSSVKGAWLFEKT
jgi:hypothetical protein